MTEQNEQENLTGQEPAAEAQPPVAEPVPAVPAEVSEAAAAPEAPVTEQPVAEPAIEQPVEPVPAEAKVKEKAKPRVIEGERKWYVIQTLTGQEDRAKQALEQTIQDEGLKDRVFQVLVPLEETIEIKNGKRYERVRKMFPGYVFVDMLLDEETWYLIRQTAGVARFIGTKVKPTPVSEKEMARVLKQLGKEERLEVAFEKGEGVRVISGAFRGYTGSVDEINEEKGKLKVLINIFGRDTPVEVNFEHAQKIN
ncbi:MAG: transcription termination/antitermination protein NusG [Candidatus Margulisbacteria bacterium]|jgi:transcriptional antiterminator NusG|nr:transcription termination/antitermination protein NusG [Candidatus Margulisiibacteriota bacterium]